MIINHNMMAINTHRQMGNNSVNASKSMEKLSSGKRINRAGDDAAGLSISETMRGQIRGLNQAKRNAQDGVSFVQTAEGALDEVSNMLVRMKELAVQKTTGTYSADDKAAIDAELTELGTEIDSIKTNTKFNEIAITAGATVTYGHNGGQSITVAGVAFAGGLSSGSSVGDIEAQIKAVNTDRGKLGASQNRLESVVRNTASNAENLQAAESRIRDTDMAKEMMEFTKNNILQQAANAMLAQANQVPQNVLSILR